MINLPNIHFSKVNNILIDRYYGDNSYFTKTSLYSAQQSINNSLENKHLDMPDSLCRSLEHLNCQQQLRLLTLVSEILFPKYEK